MHRDPETGSTQLRWDWGRAGGFEISFHEAPKQEGPHILGSLRNGRFYKLEGFINWLPLLVPLCCFWELTAVRSITLGNGKTRTWSALGH